MKQPSVVDAVRRSLARGPWFAGLPDAIQAHLVTCGHDRRLRKGEYLVRKGDPTVGLFGLIDGQMRAQVSTGDGRTALLGLVHPGDFFGFLACADGSAHAADWVANVETRLWVVPYPAVCEAFHGDAALTRYLISPQLKSSRRTAELLALMPRRTPRGRLAERLLEFSRSHYYPDGPRHPILGLSQELLSTALYCTRQTTNELLGEFEAAGLISCDYGRIDIRDEERLRAILDETE